MITDQYNVHPDKPNGFSDMKLSVVDFITLE